MAIALSHLFSRMSGSVGGTTYFRNRYAAIVLRSRVTPTDPATAGQVVVRTRFSAAVTAWQALTATERNSWEMYADGTPWVNSIGDDVRLTGFNMYLAVRLAVLKINPGANPALLATASCVPGLNIQPKFSLSAGSAPNVGFLLSLTHPHPTDNMRVGVHVSTAQNTSVNFWKGPYDINQYQSCASIPAGLGTTLEWKSLTLGKRYFLRIRAWNSTQRVLVSSPTLTNYIAVNGV